jgi:hypothetical protein
MKSCCQLAKKIWKSKSELTTFLAILVGVYATYILIREIFLRSKIGFGLTDEAYGITFGIDRAKNGQLAFTPLYADITSFALKLADFNITYFRYMGAVILVCFSIILFLIHRFLQSGLYSNLESGAIFIIFVICGLFVSTSFRYLLITPSYQWYVLVFSTIGTSLLLLRGKLKNDATRDIILVFVALLVLLTVFARPTSGIASWLVINVFLLRKNSNHRKRDFSLFNLSLISFTVVYTVVNGAANLRYLETYWEMRKLDPRGSNVFYEIWDIGTSVTTTVLMVFIGYLWTQRYYEFKAKVKLSHSTLTFCATFIILLYLLLHYPYRDPPHLLALLILSLFGAFCRIDSIKQIQPQMIILCTSPLISQFGSNISASYLIAPSLISGLFLAFLVNGDQGLVHFRLGKNVHARNVSVYFLIIISALSILIGSTKNQSYESNNKSEKLVVDSVTGLHYSRLKMDAISEFRRNAGVSGEYSGDRVIDLSYWHPGVVMLLGGIQFSATTFDVQFKSSIELQVDRIVSEYNSNPLIRADSFIIRTQETEFANRCQRLSEHLQDRDIAFALIERNFDPYVRDSSIYLSSRVDETLYPLNIALLTPCK